MNDHGVLFYTTPTTEEGLSNITMKGLKDDVGVTHQSLPMELIPIQANTWSHMLFYGSQLRKRPLHLILWSPKDSKILANIHHFTHPPHLNNQNEVIYHDGKEYKFYEEGNEFPLSELIDIEFLTILDIIDFNDQGSLLIRGHILGLKQPEYYLLIPPKDDPNPTDDDWEKDWQNVQQGDTK